MHLRELIGIDLFFNDKNALRMMFKIIFCSFRTKTKSKLKLENCWFMKNLYIYKKNSAILACCLYKYPWLK